ncbi:hypothetical protein CYMTET_13915 [Cymbomonas tetramitiformis]|uniref:Uncharacterized protein n=1 Tax=Cymbomonas tetramitiformis TaxID=36881 RepID=A0AAE0GHN0_9CHLO|nr:hypothetical protein CYMTET_13915 [Cymbomonas tetramitiformis]
MVRCYVAENQEDWDLWVTPVEYAINDYVSAATGYTPFELLANQFAQQLKAARVVSLQMARQQRMIEQFEARHRLQQMKVNDQVGVDGQHLTLPGDRGLRPKLRMLWHGPLRIVECLYSDRQHELPEQDRGAPSAYSIDWGCRCIGSGKRHAQQTYSAGTTGCTRDTADFDMVWASPPCKEYTKAKTTRGTPDLELTDRRVQRTREIIEYYNLAYYFIENPRISRRRATGLHARAMM